VRHPSFSALLAAAAQPAKPRGLEQANDGRTNFKAVAAVSAAAGRNPKSPCKRNFELSTQAAAASQPPHMARRRRRVPLAGGLGSFLGHGPHRLAAAAVWLWALGSDAFRCTPALHGAQKPPASRSRNAHASKSNYMSLDGSRSRQPWNAVTILILTVIHFAPQSEAGEKAQAHTIVREDMCPETQNSSNGTSKPAGRK
jgi:hypothetical protein